MKGYIISFSAILLLSSMLLFSLFYSENVNQRNLSVKETGKYSKAEYVKDDLGFDLNKLLGTEIKVEKNSELKIIFREKIPADFNKSERISKFKEFVENGYSLKSNIQAKLNAERLSSAIRIKFSNKLVYEYGFKSGSSVFFYAENSDTNVYAMDLNLDVQGSSVEVLLPVSSLTPDLAVNFNYVDQNVLNEKHQIFGFDSAVDNVMRIRFSDALNDEIEIHIGSFEGKINAVKVWNKTLSQQKILFSFKTIMPLSDINSSLRAFVDLDLNYSQADLNSNYLIELNQLS